MILPTRKKNLTHDVTHCKVWENWWKTSRGDESLGVSGSGDHGVGGRGVGMRGAWRPSLATAMGAPSPCYCSRGSGALCSSLDGIEVFHHLERERQKEEKKSCGFRGCLLSCPKSLNLGRQRLDDPYIIWIVRSRQIKAGNRIARNILTAFPEKQRELRAVSSVFEFPRMRMDPLGLNRQRSVGITPLRSDPKKKKSLRI